jgi:hypothetical protein
MQFSAIYALVQDSFDSSSAFTTKAKAWVNAAYHDVVSRKDWSWAQRVAAVDSVAGSQHYSLVGNTSMPDLRSVMDVYWMGQGTRKLKELEARLFDEITLASSVFTNTVGSTASGATTVNVASTTGYPSSGVALVGPYTVTYTGTTSTTLTGVSGIGGTVATLSAVRSVLTAIAPAFYTVGGGAPEASAAAGVAGGVQRLSVWPAPVSASAGALQVRMSRGVGTMELSADTDVPILPTRHHYALVEGAISLGLESEDDAVGAARWQDRFERRIQAMIAEDEGMRHADPDELVERQAVAAR